MCEDDNGLGLRQIANVASHDSAFCFARGKCLGGLERAGRFSHLEPHRRSFR
jgi:hypothetical protein